MEELGHFCGRFSRAVAFLSSCSGRLRLGLDGSSNVSLKTFKGISILNYIFLIFKNDLSSKVECTNLVYYLILIKKSFFIAYEEKFETYY